MKVNQNETLFKQTCTCAHSLNACPILLIGLLSLLSLSFLFILFYNTILSFILNLVATDQHIFIKCVAKAMLKCRKNMEINLFNYQITLLKY